MSKLIWKEIPEFSRYVLTSTAEIIEKETGPSLTPLVNNWGSSYVNIFNDEGARTQKVIRKLMIEVYLPKPEKYNWELLYRDKNEQNLALDNIFWKKKVKLLTTVHFDVDTETLVRTEGETVHRYKPVQRRSEKEEPKADTSADVEAELENEPETEQLQMEYEALSEKERFNLRYQIDLIVNYYDDTLEKMNEISDRLEKVEEKLKSLSSLKDGGIVLEEWKNIDIASDYEVSSFGRVRNVVTKDILNQEASLKHGGNMTVLTYGLLEHEVRDLVLDAFKPFGWSRGKREIVHIDGNIKNCRLDNLEVYYDGKKALRLIKE